MKTLFSNLIVIFLAAAVPGREPDFAIVNVDEAFPDLVTLRHLVPGAEAGRHTARPDTDLHSLAVVTRVDRAQRVVDGGVLRRRTVNRFKFLWRNGHVGDVTCFDCFPQ